MTARRNAVLPLASVPSGPVVPRPANDVLPTATLTMADVRQRLSQGRTRMVRVETRARQRFNLYACVEKALFPRLFWAICGASFDQDDPETAALMAGLRADMEIWAGLMLPGQRMDFERELNHSARCALEPMLDRQIGHDGGWHTVKMVMVFLYLVKWVDDCADGAMFTTDFARLAQDIASHVDALHGDECDAVDASARKVLPKVIARLKSCGVFGWLPEYRGVEE